MSSAKDWVASKELLQAIVANTTEAVFVKDLDGRYIFCNEAGARLAGRPLAEIIGHTDRELIPEATALSFITEDQRVLASGGPETFESRVVIDGEPRVILATKYLYRAPDGTPAGVIGMCRDITDRVQAVERLRESERFLELVLDALPLGVVVIDVDGDVVFANRAAKRIWGESIHRGTERWERSRGFWHTTGEPVKPHEWASVRALVEGVAELDQLVDIDAFDGARRTIRNSAVPIMQDGVIHRVVIVNEDVTERVRLEDGVAKVRKIEAIGQLAGGVVHDFNNLLTIIMTYVEVVGVGLEEDDPRRHDLGEIQRAADSAAALTRQILTFGRRDMVQPRNVSVESVVEGVERLLARLIGEHIRVRIDYAPEPSIVLIDPSQIEQLVLNLAVNARDAMPNGGELTITTSTVDVTEADAPALGLAHPGRYARLSVRDTGTGMDEATRARIFEPFFTTKERGRGTGLGLATVQAIVTQYAGAVRVESALGKGTTFELHLPVAEATRSDEAPVAPARELRGSEHVLLVEDSAPVRLAVRAILERYGYDVHDAGDVGAALAHAARKEVSVDVLLTDLVLPAMSGRELATAVLDRHPSARVLFMSGYRDDTVSVEHEPASPGRVLAKPFSAAVLARALREAIDG